MNYVEEYYSQTPGPGQVFGAPRDGRTHQGVDWSHSTKPGIIDVPAIEAGKVTGNYWTDGYGWRLEIHPWSFSHLAERSELEYGDMVFPGDIVGKEGKTGFVSGNCCHVEYVKGGVKVDPLPIIRSLTGGSSASTLNPRLDNKMVITVRDGETGEIILIPEGGKYKSIPTKDEYNRYRNDVEVYNSYQKAAGRTLMLNQLPTWEELGAGKYDFDNSDVHRLIEMMGATK